MRETVEALISSFSATSSMVRLAPSRSWRSERASRRSRTVGLLLGTGNDSLLLHGGGV
jgi:hypothetical protein